MSLVLGDGDIVVPLALLCAKDPLVVFVGAETSGDGLVVDGEVWSLVLGDGDIVIPLALLLCAEDPLLFVGAEAIGDGLVVAGAGEVWEGSAPLSALLGAGEMFVALF